MGRYLVPGPKRRRVNSARNSVCGSARIEDLDFSRWWMDGGDGSPWGAAYLKVPHRGHDGMEGTVHRVRCRFAERPRLEMRDGVLYWVIDAEPGDG